MRASPPEKADLAQLRSGPRRSDLASRVALVVLGALLGAPLMACGGGPPPAVALENRTFYQYDDMPTASGASPFERPYPPLDAKGTAGLPDYVGVSLLGGTVHLSRPAGWRIRRASLTPARRYVEYVSPNEYVFAVYERIDAPQDPWRDVLGRYEEDVKTKGATLLGQRIPVATWNAQGREYVVRRTVKGQRGDFANVSREVLLRGEHRVELVSIVHQGESIAPIGGELLRVMETLELL